ncbi:hypothetical protein OPT61_g2920 [Boeremia exigua]|uniref:Uncharacterized protein n=1 Tax=Boeremia exigua TaxID=749465 RepID=A0ACC2IJT0_9PLEO|nr:hypothetical protein OPT61_g2920 [Boeremia exigua]
MDVPGSHNISPWGEVDEAEPTGSLESEQEDGIYNASSSVLCEKCIALTYQGMRASEASPQGQLHHDNWASLAKAATLGCRLCTFFTVAALHPKSKPGNAFYSDKNGPIYLKIAETWQKQVINRLPKLYQDAIYLTKALGKQYIWVDSLCIIQDSKDDWASECERMSDVYSNSCLTISAMSYRDNLQGFQEVHSDDIPPHCLLCPLPGHPGTRVCVRSMVDHESRTDYLKARGWAFQELLLSPRVLHFTTTAMAFECDTCTTMERGPGSDSLFGYDPERKRLVYAADSLHIRYYDRWLQIVQSYSHLNLTYNSDRLPALSGIACLVASKTDDRYVAGLWRQDIAAGLLWYVWPCRPLESAYVGPSWSWASPPAVWTFDPERRRFLKLDVIDVDAQLATSNPYGEISAARLVVSGPLKQCTTSQLVKKGPRFFVLKGERSLTVRFAFDEGRIDSRTSSSIWCLDCTSDKALDIEMARLSKRRETFLRPHGLILERVQETVYKRIGAFEIFDIPDDGTGWHNTDFVTTTVSII